MDFLMCTVINFCYKTYLQRGETVGTPGGRSCCISSSSPPLSVLIRPPRMCGCNAWVQAEICPRRAISSSPRVSSIEAILMFVTCATVNCFELHTWAPHVSHHTHVSPIKLVTSFTIGPVPEGWTGRWHLGGSVLALLLEDHVLIVIIFWVRTFSE